jgi:hypothetical protein
LHACTARARSDAATLRDIFTTRSGELRLVLDKKRSVWVEHKKELELIQLPVEDNHVLIYQDLGVYLGQRLGTPCDDLL